MRKRLDPSIFLDLVAYGSSDDDDGDDDDDKEDGDDDRDSEDLEQADLDPGERPLHSIPSQSEGQRAAAFDALLERIVQRFDRVSSCRAQGHSPSPSASGESSRVRHGPSLHDQVNIPDCNDSCVFSVQVKVRILCMCL